jgi:hypothetical protein
LRFGSGKIGTEAINVLGFELNDKRLEPLKKNIGNIQKFRWDEMKSKKLVRKFLGATGFYRSLIKDYAEVTNLWRRQ